MMQLISAAVIGGIICSTYRISHSRAIYSRSFETALLMFTLMSSLSISILSKNIVLALGALSVVRYRSVIKDHRDMIFLFWSIGAGIACGVEEYVFVGIGSLIILAVSIIYGIFHNYDRKLLIIRGKVNLENSIMEVINKNFKEKIRLKVNNSNEKMTEVIYEIKKFDLNNLNSTCDKAKEELYKLEGIECVNIIQQIEEMGV